MDVLPIRASEFYDFTESMGAEESAVLYALLRLFYQHECPLNIDPDNTYAIARLTQMLGFPNECRRIVRRVLGEHFVSLPAHQYIPRIDGSLPRYQPWHHSLQFIGAQLDKHRYAAFMECDQ